MIPRHTRQSAAQMTGMSLLMPIGLAILSLIFLSLVFLSLVFGVMLTTAHADELVSESAVGSVIDAPATAIPVTAAGVEQIVEQIKEQVTKEQEELASKDRDELEQRANNGERLAQVALGDDFADEAQQILFAPAAANSAISDALAWYSLAAQRGFPGSLSLDSSGVKLHPVRVVRNQ